MTSCSASSMVKVRHSLVPHAPQHRLRPTFPSIQSSSGRPATQIRLEEEGAFLNAFSESGLACNLTPIPRGLSALESVRAADLTSWPVEPHRGHVRPRSSTNRCQRISRILGMATV